MEAGIKPGEVCAALNRLIGSGPYRETQHTNEWRRVVKTSDGHEHAVRVAVNLHRKDHCAKAAMNDIADRLLLDRKDLVDVLANWTADQLREHLERHTLAELREPAMRRFR